MGVGRIVIETDAVTHGTTRADQLNCSKVHMISHPKVVSLLNSWFLTCLCNS
jgi:hypothetical protein